MKSTQRFLAHHWVLVVWAGIGLLLTCALLLFRLDTLVSGIHPEEQQIISNSASLGSIAENPINAPYKLVAYGLSQWLGNTVSAVRLASTLFGLIAVVLFFCVLNAWHTTRIAVLGTMLFATSSWFLHVSRFGTPDVMLFGILALIVVGLWIKDSKRRNLAFVASVVASCLAVYIPGLVWFIAAAFVWRRNILLAELKRLHIATVILSILLAIVLLVPLVYGAVNDISMLITLAGLPERLPTLPEAMNNLISVPTELFVRGPADSARWLGRLPLLDIFTAVMFVLGLYAYYFRLRLDRTRLLLAMLVIGSVVIAFAGPVNITLIMPIVYIVVAAGITLMLQQWFTVFPRNPLARSLGTSVISIAVLLTAFYHLNHYFIAWPNAPETKEIFLSSDSL